MAPGKCVVIDTNVWAVAEGMHGGASDECVAACLALLRRVDTGLLLAVDQGDEILAEYMSVLRAGKTSGLATKLAIRLWHTRRDPQVCKAIAITRRDDPPGSYAEVPPNLHDFDADDQKFIAVAVAEGSTPLLFQALDGEWWQRQADLNDAGLNVQFLCAADLLAEK